MIQKIIQFVLTYLTIRQIFTETTNEATRDETDTRRERSRDVHGNSPSDSESPTEPRRTDETTNTGD